MARLLKVKKVHMSVRYVQVIEAADGSYNKTYGLNFIIIRGPQTNTFHQLYITFALR
jgi:hypothetical protein